MLIRLFLLFTLVPLLELALLVRVGGWIGFLPTVALVALTGAVGAALARREGIRTWRTVRSELAAGRLPGREMIHALVVLAAGIFLVTPGLLTDAAGTLLLLEPVRDTATRALRRRLERAVRRGSVGVWVGTGGGRREGGDAPGPGPQERGPTEEEGEERGREGRVIEI